MAATPNGNGGRNRDGATSTTGMPAISRWPIAGCCLVHPHQAQVAAAVGELGIEVPPAKRVAAAFIELAQAI